MSGKHALPTFIHHPAPAILLLQYLQYDGSIAMSADFRAPSATFATAKMASYRFEQYRAKSS